MLQAMGDRLCPKVILEGNRLTFKTEIAFELNEHHCILGPRNYRYTRQCTLFLVSYNGSEGGPLLLKFYCFVGGATNLSCVEHRRGEG